MEGVMGNGEDTGRGNGEEGRHRYWCGKRVEEGMGKGEASLMGWKDNGEGSGRGKGSLMRMEREWEGGDIVTGMGGE